MLIEFRVENFRSFRDEQSLLMTALTTKGKRNQEHLTTNTFPCPALGKDERLVTSAGIYGANAAGKSNLCAAASVFKYILTSSRLNDESEIEIRTHSRHKIAPFLLNEKTKDEPTAFEITFIPNDNIKYQYGFKILNNVIKEEWLFAFPEKRSRTYFIRDVENQINFPSDNIKGDKVSLADKTTENNLFLNVAATFNHPQLRPLHEYLNLYLEVPDDYASTLPLHTHLYTKNNSVAKKQVEEFLSYADLGITDFKVTEGKSSYLPDIEFGHRNSESNKKTYFDIYEESAGTRRLFNMLGPVLIGLHYGGIIFLDEIQSSLHPLLSHKLLELFNNPEKNKKNAQLIFTTHDTTLMDKDFMRRDQIWFVEKDAAGASHLYPLLDYSPKQNESLSKGYLEGRYGAIPVFGEWNM